MCLKRHIICLLGSGQHTLCQDQGTCHRSADYKRYDRSSRKHQTSQNPPLYTKTAWTNSGQYESAVTVGMTPFRAMKQIVVPQLIANLLPNLTNILLDLVKDTALVYNIGIVEIMGQANIISSLGFKYLETYLDALIVYIVICWVIARLFQLTEFLMRRRYSPVNA